VTQLATLKKLLQDLRRTIDKLQFMLISAPNVPRWDEVRAEVATLNSLADKMRQVLDLISER
jgi:hypothetical protein